MHMCIKLDLRVNAYFLLISLNALIECIITWRRSLYPFHFLYLRCALQDSSSSWIRIRWSSFFGSDALASHWSAAIFIISCLFLYWMYAFIFGSDPTVFRIRCARLLLVGSAFCFWIRLHALYLEPAIGAAFSSLWFALGVCSAVRADSIYVCVFLLDGLGWSPDANGISTEKDQPAQGEELDWKYNDVDFQPTQTFISLWTSQEKQLAVDPGLALPLHHLVRSASSSRSLVGAEVHCALVVAALTGGSPCRIHIGSLYISTTLLCMPPGWTQ